MVSSSIRQFDGSSEKKTKYNVFELSKREIMEITVDTFLITFEEKIDFSPGQFCMVDVNDFGLTRKPFTLGSDAEGRIMISVKIVGAGTEYIVKTQNKLNILAPLGRGFLPPNKNGAIIVAPSCLAEGLELSRYFDVPLFVASRTNLNDDIVQHYGLNYIIGDYDYIYLLEKLKFSNFEWFFVSGSKKMEEITTKHLSAEGIKEVFVSLNEYMACGIGACKGCAVETTSGIKHVCQDGPVFRGDEIWR
ncbi:MAG: oxidoreductase [Fervidobacterium sp.]|uniref:Dihydroorotate dehydrogenase electron transfer subunit n=1 Tax=Fervidobacterium gondwanense DSM 13020 TaxID=1121883 RepID=A0A1M7SZK3_FERGO|nr:oxidoreductase [Fervidobacterium gondwanense]SHN63943.1 dihydroorotate dehydrogenase electron transfer subunit [Fervidobacterium gondwanense DSM 13020]